MELYRVMMSIHSMHDGWKRISPVATFYVHAVSCAEARRVAISIVSTSNESIYTSGNVLRVNEELESTNPEEYISWNK